MDLLAGVVCISFTSRYFCHGSVLFPSPASMRVRLSRFRSSPRYLFFCMYSHNSRVFRPCRLPPVLFRPHYALLSGWYHSTPFDWLSVLVGMLAGWRVCVVYFFRRAVLFLPARPDRGFCRTTAPRLCARCSWLRPSIIVTAVPRVFLFSGLIYSFLVRGEWFCEESHARAVAEFMLNIPSSVWFLVVDASASTARQG